MSLVKILKRAFLFTVWFLCFLFLTEICLGMLGHICLRKRSLKNIADQQAFNIVCLGDSFTYGWGVETADTYPKQLEKMLNRPDSRIRFRVFNLAVPGSNSSQHLKVLESLLKQYDGINMVIVLTGANDAWNFAYSNIDKIMRTESTLEQIATKAKITLSRLKIYKMIKLFMLNLKGRTFEFQIDPFEQIPRYENIDENILRGLLEYNLTQIASLAKSNNAKLILHNYPRGDLYGDNIAQKIALRFKAPFVDNSFRFKERLKEVDFKDLFLYDNSHPNSAGCRIMAEAICQAIGEEILR